MDKILDRLGIYDLWGVFIPGIIGWFSIKILFVYLNICFGTGLGNVGDLSFILVCSYLLGTILHDFGRVVAGRLLYKRKKEPSYVYLSCANDLFNEYEKQVYEKIMRKTIKITGNVKEEYMRYFYDYCYEFLSAWQKSAKADKFESLYGMSRSLFCFYILMGTMVIVIYPILIAYNFNIDVKRFIISVMVCFFLSSVFYRRALMFNESRVKVVLRTYISMQSKKIKDLKVKDL